MVAAWQPAQRRLENRKHLTADAQRRRRGRLDKTSRRGAEAAAARPDQAKYQNTRRKTYPSMSLLRPSSIAQGRFTAEGRRTTVMAYPLSVFSTRETTMASRAREELAVVLSDPAKPKRVESDAHNGGRETHKQCHKYFWRWGAARRWQQMEASTRADANPQWSKRQARFDTARNTTGTKRNCTI